MMENNTMTRNFEDVRGDIKQICDICKDWGFAECDTCDNRIKLTVKVHRSD
jgi:hypothetical protein